jgi:DNA-binding response OmpR family regulator
MHGPRILFAHERPSVARAVERVLVREGFEVRSLPDGISTERVLASERHAALVVDVALPGIPGYELTRIAKSLAAASPDRGAEVVVLIASVYRRTSYKRRPSRLYGADDYVEIHHLGDLLPVKLRRLLRMPQSTAETDHEVLQVETAEALRVEGDERMTEHDEASLASLIVADMVLYNGDRILTARDLTAAQAAVSEDLAIARDLFDQVARFEGRAAKGVDPVGEAFRRLMEAMGRLEEGT